MYTRGRSISRTFILVRVLQGILHVEMQMGMQIEMYHYQQNCAQVERQSSEFILVKTRQTDQETLREPLPASSGILKWIYSTGFTQVEALTNS